MTGKPREGQTELHNIFPDQQSEKEGLEANATHALETEQMAQPGVVQRDI
jgi:hypothetical protein